MDKKILIVDGNLFARKMFYKFKMLKTTLTLSELSKKPDLRDLQTLLETNYTNKTVSPKPDKKIVNSKTGKEMTVKESVRISEKINKIINSPTEVTIETGVIYGMLRSLIKINRDYNIGKIIFCFDPVKRNRVSSYRYKLSNDYKASREENSVRKKDETIQFYSQLFISNYILELLGIEQIWSETFEADDLLDHLCKGKYKDKEIILLTSDHDLFQIITDKVNILTIGSEGEMITESTIKGKFGISPNQWLDYMTLIGCRGDDVKGLLGEKTSLSLMMKYENIPNIFKNLKSVKKDLKEKDYNKLLKEKENDLSFLKKTRKLVRLYGGKEDIEREIFVKRSCVSKKNALLLIEMLNILKFRSLLGKEEIKSLVSIVKNQK